MKPTVNFLRLLYVVIVFCPDRGIRNNQKLPNESDLGYDLNSEFVMHNQYFQKLPVYPQKKRILKNAKIVFLYLIVDHYGVQKNK